MTKWLWVSSYIIPTIHKAKMWEKKLPVFKQSQTAYIFLLHLPATLSLNICLADNSRLQIVGEGDLGGLKIQSTLEFHLGKLSWNQSSGSSKGQYEAVWRRRSREIEKKRWRDGNCFSSSLTQRLGMRGLLLKINWTGVNEERETVIINCCYWRNNWNGSVTFSGNWIWLCKLLPENLS